VRGLGLLLAAVALGVAGWWWFTSEAPRREREREAAARAAMAEAERAGSLYRWRDAQGNLQVSDEPPKGRRYERISREPADGLEVRGSRD
jgi:hypothetical protein